MQRSEACLAISSLAVTAAGASIHATRKPGASVFEKLLRYSYATQSVVGPDRPNVGLGGRVLEVQVAVRVVFDQQDVATLRPLEERGALGASHQQAGRVLEIWHHVEQPGATPLLLEPHVGFVQLGQVDAVGVLVDPHHLGLDVAERRDRAGVSRQLDEDHVVRVEQHARDEVETLL